MNGSTVFLFEKFHMEQLKFVTVYTDLFHNKIVIRMKFNFKAENIPYISP